MCFLKHRGFGAIHTEHRETFFSLSRNLLQKPGGSERGRGKSEVERDKAINAGEGKRKFTNPEPNSPSSYTNSSRDGPEANIFPIQQGGEERGDVIMKNRKPFLGLVKRGVA